MKLSDIDMKSYLFNLCEWFVEILKSGETVSPYSVEGYLLGCYDRYKDAPFGRADRNLWYGEFYTWVEDEYNSRVIGVFPRTIPLPTFFVQYYEDTRTAAVAYTCLLLKYDHCDDLAASVVRTYFQVAADSDGPMYSGLTGEPGSGISDEKAEMLSIQLSLLPGMHIAERSYYGFVGYLSGLSSSGSYNDLEFIQRFSEWAFQYLGLHTKNGLSMLDVIGHISSNDKFNMSILQFCFLRWKRTEISGWRQNWMDAQTFPFDIEFVRR